MLKWILICCVPLAIVFIALCSGLALAADASSAAQSHSNVLAVIGGSHIDRRDVKSFFSDDDKVLETFVVDTSTGPSPPILKMQHKDIPFYYVQFHGFADVAASDMAGGNFVRMFAAFHKLGVTHIIASAASGAMQSEYRFDK